MSNTAMVNNKQVNFWRGDTTPPTIYHIWIRDNSKMLLYDGSKWVVFLDNKEIIEAVNKFQKALDDMQSQINELGNKTVNRKPIKNNPVLDGSDILNTSNGNFISKNDTISNALIKLDHLLTTQIFE